MTEKLRDVIVTISGVPNTSKVLMQGIFAQALRQHGIAEVVYTDKDHTPEQIEACVAAQATEKHHEWEKVRVTFLTHHLPKAFDGEYLLEKIHNALSAQGYILPVNMFGIVMAGLAATSGDNSKEVTRAVDTILAAEANTERRPDFELSAVQLQRRYGLEEGGEHPDYPASTWVDQVTRHKLMIGYWDWLVERLEEDKPFGPG